MPPSPRRGAAPDPAALGELSAPPAAERLPKAPAVDPVLGSSPQERTVRPELAAPAVVSTGPARKEKSNFYAHADELARARAAYLHTHVSEGHRSWGDFVAFAVRQEVARLEAEHHGGLPWAPVAAGQLPTGRPLQG